MRHYVMRRSSGGVLTAEQDWQNRIAGSGVVWYHDFRTDNEVNQFRWTQNFGTGNDPTGVGSANAANVRRITTDGITGACLELFRSGSLGDANFSYWHRPFSPIQGGTTTGNGRGAGLHDPGASGTITALPYAPTPGGNQTATWPDGVYGTRSGGGPYDGEEFYLQCRVKIDPRRGQGINKNEDSGKLFFITRCDRSNGDQEVVVYSGTQHSPGEDTYFRMYRQSGFHLDKDPTGNAEETRGNQPGSDIGLCKITSVAAGSINNCWHWNNGEWDTIMFRVRPGTMSGAIGSQTSNSDTLIEVYAAHQGETEFTRIWRQTDASVNYDIIWGYSAVICAIYHNGATMTDFWQRYCQIIFSKQFIPCPLV